MYIVLLCDESVDEIPWNKYMKKVSTGAGQRTEDLEEALFKALRNITKTANKWERVILFMAQLGKK